VAHRVSFASTAARIDQFFLSGSARGAQLTGVFTVPCPELIFWTTAVALPEVMSADVARFGISVIV
jgi:hypothetical protein